MTDITSKTKVLRFFERDRCAALAAGLLILIFAGSFDDGTNQLGLVVATIYSTVIVIGVLSVCGRGVWFWMGSVLAAITIVNIWTKDVGDGGAARDSLAAAGQLFLLYLSARVIRLIRHQDEPASNRIYAAVCGYLCIGILFAAIYSLLIKWQPDAIAGAGTGPGGVITRSDLTYFSFVTQTTLGYGEMTPRTPQARSIAILQAVFGVLFLAITIASLVAKRDKVRA